MSTIEAFSCRRLGHSPPLRRTGTPDLPALPLCPAKRPRSAFRERIVPTWVISCLCVALGSAAWGGQHSRTAAVQNRFPQQTSLSLVTEQITDAEAEALGLSVCRLYVQFDSPDDRLLSVGFGSI